MVIKSWWVTLQFMTRLPVPQRWTRDYAFERVAEGIVSFPLVGLLMGALAIGITWLAEGHFAPRLAGGLYLLALAVLTGGFHLDGLADTCDGIFSARTRERMLEIMKDSRLGTHGALGLIFTLLLKALAVGQLLDGPHPAWGALVAAPVVGRSLMALLMYHQRYARSNGLGNLYIGKISGRQLGITLGGGLLLAVLLCGGAGLWGWLGCLLFAWGYRQALYRTLGGQTGDTLGGGNELFELCFLLLLC